jgi:hypothetical protein
MVKSPMKLVVVNSLGPMGSSCVAAIVEKFGFMNLPVRKHGLNDYLCGERGLEDPFFKERFIEVFKGHGRKNIKIGGVNIEDRDVKIPGGLINFSLIESCVEELENKQFDSIASMYKEFRELYASAIIYKSNNSKPGNHVELATTLYRYPSDKIYSAHLNQFGDTVFIHMHRDFVGWLESSASQHFVQPDKRYRFKFHSYLKRYQTYERSTKHIPGVHINFSDLFLPNTGRVIDKISSAVRRDVGEVDWRSESFDLYGKVRSFQETFVQADYEGKYFSAITRNLSRLMYNLGMNHKVFSVFFYPFYLYELCIYRLKKII